MDSRGRSVRKTVSTLNGITAQGTQALRRASKQADAFLTGQVDRKLASESSKGVRFAEPSSGHSVNKLEKSAGTSAKVSRAVSQATERACRVTGDVLFNNSVSRSLRQAPEGSKRRAVHDIGTASVLCTAKLTTAVAEEGRYLLERSTDGAARVAGSKHGLDAERSTRAVGNIGINAYEVLRTPQQFVKSSVFHGCAKAGIPTDQPQQLDAYGRPVIAQGAYSYPTNHCAPVHQPGRELAPPSALARYPKKSKKKKK